MSHNQWIDISVAVREGMPVWPGDPGLRLERVMDQKNGAKAGNISKLESESFFADGRIMGVLHGATRTYPLFIEKGGFGCERPCGS